MNPIIARIEVGGIADASGIEAAPGALLVSLGGTRTPLKRPGATVLCAGRSRDVSSHPVAPRARVVRLPDVVLIPGLVNAHTHLDLTHIGPRAHDPSAGFAAWADMIIASRLTDAPAVRASVRRGAALSLAGGVVAVGDIAGVGLAAPVEAIRESDLLGVSFVEFFGMGAGQEAAAARMRAVMGAIEPEAGAVRAGIQPHAPYSAGLRLFDAAVELHRATGAPLATHLAETVEERRFIGSAEGPIRGLLERLGIWDETTGAELGRGAHPVEHLRDALAAAPFLLAHVNDVCDHEIATLAATGASVAYCPRGHEYFGHPEAIGPHPYRRLLDAGVNVALGTDSIVNLWSPEGGGVDRLSTLDEMRLLGRRDGAPPRLLLRMATLNGALALGLPPSWFDFSPGPVAGIGAVNVAGTPPGDAPLDRVLGAIAPARLLTIDDVNGAPP